MKIYYVETENKHNQLLIFKTKKAALKWLEKATRFTAEEASKKICVAEFKNGYASIFPNI